MFRYVSSANYFGEVLEWTDMLISIDERDDFLAFEGGELFAEFLFVARLDAGRLDILRLARRLLFWLKVKGAE